MRHKITAAAACAAATLVIAGCSSGSGSSGASSSGAVPNALTLPVLIFFLIAARRLRAGPIAGAVKG